MPRLKWIASTAATRVARTLAAGLGIFAVVVGAHDALRVSVLADRLTGTAFALAGALLLAAAVASRRPRHSGTGEDWRLLLGVAAGLVGIGVGAFLLLAALEDPDARGVRWLAPWVAVVCAGIAIATVYLVVGRGRIGRSAKGSLSLVASGVAATVLIGLVQLWHESASKASRDNPNVVLEARVTPAERVGALRAFEVEFRARNLSDVPVVVVGSRYSAVGLWFEKLPPGQRTDEAFGERLWATKWSVHRAAGIQDVEFVHGGPLIPDNYILFPDERYVSRRVIVTEPGRYDELDIFGYAYVARQDRLSVAIPSVPDSTPQRIATGILSETALEGRVERLPIEDSSLIGRLTGPARDLLRVRIIDAEGDYEDLVAYVDVRGREGTRPPSQVGANASLDRYGFTVATTSNEIFVGPSDAPPPGPAEWDTYEPSDDRRLNLDPSNGDADAIRSRH